MRGSDRRHRLGLTRFVIVAATALLLAQSLLVDGQGVASASPAWGAGATELLTATSEPGPFAVGSTVRCLERPTSPDGEVRSISTVLWYPAVGAELAGSVEDTVQIDAQPAREAGPYPVFVWSHGKLHEPTASSFLAHHLASHGIVVIAPSHLGVPFGACSSPVAGLHSNGAPADEIRGRREDVQHTLTLLIDAPLDQDPLLDQLLDSGRVGIGGHSRGAGTALHLASADPRFGAVVAMALGANKLNRAAAEDLHTPTMLMGGQLDDQTPYHEQLEIFSRLAAADPTHWLVSFHGAGHFAFVDECPTRKVGCGPSGLPQPRAHELIKRWTTTFLLHHLAGREDYGPLLDPIQTAHETDASLVSARSWSVGRP